MFHSLLTRAFILIVSVSLVACSSPTIAPRKMPEAERDRRVRELFHRWDINKDGSLSREEFRRGLEARSRLSQGNDDWILGLEKKGRPSKTQPTPRPLTKEEIERAVEAAFKQQDANLNGRLTEEEFKKVVVERTNDGQGNEFWEGLL